MNSAYAQIEPARYFAVVQAARYQPDNFQFTALEDFTVRRLEIRP
jgi:hypothetical protein